MADEQGNTKTCSKCGIDKPTTEFGRRSNPPKRLKGVCKPCERAVKKSWIERNADQVRSRGKLACHRYRAKHRERLLIEEREYRRANRDLVIQRARRWQIKNPDRVIAMRLNLNYALSLEDYRALIVRQDNMCAICGTAFAASGHKGPHVDHCHATDRVRGLLCGSCNRGIGMFKDDMALLSAALEYLRLDRSPVEKAVT